MSSVDGEVDVGVAEAQPRFQVETPDGWLRLNLHPAASNKEIKQILASITWPNLATRAAVRDQLESAVSEARAAGALLLMVLVDAVSGDDVPYRLVVGSLVLAPVSTAPHVATNEIVAEAIGGLGQIEKFETASKACGYLVASVEKADPATAALRSELRENATAQAYLAVPEQPWIVVASCTMNGSERLDLAGKIVRRLVGSLQLVN